MKLIACTFARPRMRHPLLTLHDVEHLLQLLAAADAALARLRATPDGTLHPLYAEVRRLREDVIGQLGRDAPDEDGAATA